ncbi:MAG TPA: hypothetical protein VHR66_17310 [Gemmataceae bacterium]|jgi:hypothetical protein|nr:hypothetical protein [Gemmataceae bacterium]
MGFRRPCRSIKPRLEVLGERALPSVNVPFVECHGTVTISGNKNANTIIVSDDGTNNPGSIFVQIDNQTFQSTGVVKHIVIDSGNGADSIVYELNGELDSLRTVDADLGGQNDSFIASLHAPIGATGKLRIGADGGNGDDNLSLETAGVDVYGGGVLVVGFAGGNGNDTLNMGYSGFLSGTARFFASGGNGKDTVVGNIALSSYEESETGGTVFSNGNLTACFSGGNGKDDVALSVLNADGLSSLNADVFGGHGKDTITATSNVDVHDRR